MGHTVRSDIEVPISGIVAPVPVSDIVVPVSIGVSVSGSHVPLAYQSFGPKNHY